MNILVNAIDGENRFIDEKPLEERSAHVIQAAWKYLTENTDICKFLVYYYNSPGFRKYAANSLCTTIIPPALESMQWTIIKNGWIS